jgi:predicted branched-subunit amino acid permease
MPFALPALFLTMVAPRFTDKRWAVAMGCTILSALLLTLYGWGNVAIPLAAACGALCFYTVKFQAGRRSS